MRRVVVVIIGLVFLAGCKPNPPHNDPVRQLCVNPVFLLKCPPKAPPPAVGGHHSGQTPDKHQ